MSSCRKFGYSVPKVNLKERKMTCSYSKEFSSSAFTDVENLFICEYLPISDGDAVKVYLYGLFLCKNSEYDQGIKDIASTLKLSEEKVLDCFKYWEEFGLVSILSENPLSVSYIPVKAAATTKAHKYKAEKYTEFTKGLQSLLPSRMISTNEYTEYFSIMETFSIKPEAMLMIVKYCADRKGTDIGYRYISKVARDFGSRGITTVDKVEKELSAYVYRTGEIERILRALSLTRQPDIEDLKLLNVWTEEMGFETENVIFAAKKIKKGSMKKLDELLKELYSKKSFSKEEIDVFAKEKERAYSLALRINKALSVFVEIIDTEVDTFVNKWLSYGFPDDALIFIASQCFKSGKNTLADMDDEVASLYEIGVISLTAVSDYFEAERKSDEFISKLLLTAGISRRPNGWDRQNLNVWRTWNFSDDMILEAAALSAGKSSPVAYMNGVLSNWKANGTYTVGGIAPAVKTQTDSQEAYNKEYQRRRNVAVARAQNNVEAALKINGFEEVYYRLNSIEKDLAFAEIGGDKTLQQNLETEKNNLLKKESALLKTIGLNISDLSPKFMCEKCKDTGYVGSKRCDCFDLADKKSE